MIFADSLKLQLIEKFIGAISYDDLQKLMESDILVGKLKGEALTGAGYPFITDLIRENNRLETEITRLESELTTLRSDILTLVKIMNKPYDHQSRTEFDSLKSKAGIY